MSITSSTLEVLSLVTMYMQHLKYDKVQYCQCDMYYSHAIFSALQHKQIVHFNPLCCMRKPPSAQGRNGGKRDSEVSQLIHVVCKVPCKYDNNFIDETNVEKLGHV